MSAEVTLAGAPLDPALRDHLVEVRVETTAGLPDVCTLRFSEDEIADPEKFVVIDNTKLDIDKPIKVKLTAQAGQSAEVFDGEITTIEAELGATLMGKPRVELVVVAHDKSHKMHRGGQSRTFTQVTATDVIRKMAGEHGLAVGQLFNLPGGAAATMHQVSETDWDFLSGLVRDRGGELDIAAGKLHVLDPSKLKPPVCTLQLGETLVRYRPRLSSLSQTGQVMANGWDAKKKQMVSATATPASISDVPSTAVSGSVNGTKIQTDPSHLATQPEMKAYAAGVAARVGAARVQAEAVALGDPRLVAGETVDIGGVGKRFGGKHRIVSATHIYGSQGYEVRLTLGSGGRPLAEAVNGHKRGPAFTQNPVIGIVTNNNDPDKLGRVKVKYPTLAQDTESDWVRIVREASGKERGTVSLPHVNDEVLVVFANGDPRRPYVLGTLFNGVDTPGADLLKTTSSVAARYPRDLDMKTQANALLVAGKAITVTSEQDAIAVSAGKDFKLEAGKAGVGNVTVTATGNIKAEGKTGVEISANGAVKITSTAPVTVESKAALQLKGSIVQVEATGILQLKGATVMLG